MFLTLETMCRYQILSPGIFMRANFSPAKLLPPFPPSHDHLSDVILALQININAYEESFNQVGEAIKVETDFFFFFNCRIVRLFPACFGFLG